MKYQPNSNYKSNDVVYTPEPLAKAIVNHFKPNGKILEPCCGAGAFLKYLPNADWCEIERGRDFFNQRGHYDWIVTNPPWSKIRNFIQHSMEIADNVIFLITVNHAFTKARIRDVRDAGFHIEEIALFDTPRNFPQTGFQLGAIHYKKGEFYGLTRISSLTIKSDARG